MDGLRQIGRVIVRTPLLIAAITAVVVLGGGIFVFAANSSGGNDDPTEVFLEPADSIGTNPFVNLLKTPVPTVVLARDLLPKDLKAGTASLAGGTVGLYGGTLNDAQCDREQLITFLTQNPDHAKAWAGVQNITIAQLPTYIRSLTPVQLRLDTRVTNHGYTNGTANPLQSVLQAGTAVLVDRNGVPRARCACGNPLLPPQPTTNTTYTGTPWNNFSAEALVRVTPNDQPVERFVLHDAATGKLFIRPVGTDGDADELLGGAAAKTTTTTGTTVAGSGSTSSTGTTRQGAEGLGSTSSTDGVTDTTGGTVPDTGPTVTRTSPTVTAIEPTVTVTVTEPTVTVTQPPPKIAVPDVLGRPGTEAQATVEKAGLRAVVVTTENARAQPGTVIAQDPAGGTQVDKGATVTITVAKAPPPPAKVTVPTLAGQTSADALAALKRVGLNGSVQFVPVAGAPGDRVVRSEPAAGVVVDQGSTVVLTVSQALTNGPAR